MKNLIKPISIRGLKIKSLGPVAACLAAAVALGAGVSCSGNHGNSESGHDGHSHEAHAHDDHEHNARLFLTSYGDKFEIFAETTPMVVGEDCDILAHITFLDTYKPLGEGNVTVTLTAGGKSVSGKAESASRPGVYSFELTPPAVGKASLTFRVETAEGAFVQTIGDLMVFDDEHEAHEAAEEAEPHVSNAVAFPKEMSWKSDFNTALAERRPFGEIIHTSGRIQPSSGDQRQVVAKGSGTVTFALANLADGKSVTSGQTLFHINTDATADHSLNVRRVEAESNYRAAKKALERGEQLASEGLMSQSELLQLRNAFETAEGVWKHYSSGQGAHASAVASPMTGFITSLDVANGQFVEAGQTLATVASSRDLNLRVEIPAAKAKRIAGIQSASIRPLNGGESFQTAAGSAGIVSIGKNVIEGTNRVPVILRVPNRSGLISGEFVNVDIRTDGGEEALTVPAEALLEQQGVWFLFVQVTPELFEKRSVKPGRSDGVYTEILSGLKEGERVVGRGAIMVKLAQSSGALDPHAGHMH